MSKPITVSNKLLSLIAQAPVTNKKPRMQPGFKQRLIAVLEKQLASK